MSRYFLELRFSIIDLYKIDVYNNIKGLISICVLIDYYHQVLNVFDTCNKKSAKYEKMIGNHREKHRELSISKILLTA